MNVLQAATVVIEREANCALLFSTIQGGNGGSSTSDEDAGVVDRDRIPMKIRFVPNASSEPSSSFIPMFRGLFCKFIEFLSRRSIDR